MSIGGIALLGTGSMTWKSRLSRIQLPERFGVLQSFCVLCCVQMQSNQRLATQLRYSEDNTVHIQGLAK